MSPFPRVFYPFEELSSIFIKLKLLSRTSFSLEGSGICRLGKGSLVLCTIFFPSHWLLTHFTTVQTMGSSEKGVTSVAIIIINPQKEYWPSQGSNQGPQV